MLKMGQMCHCKSTLWKIDVTDGTIVWNADRGNQTQGLALYDDGSDVYLYETGTGGSATAIKWRDDGSNKTKIWGVTPSIGGTCEFSLGDTELWTHSSTTVFRLSNSDGSTDSSATISPTPPYYFVDGPSGTMFGASRGAAYYPSSTNLFVMSSTPAVTTTLSSLWPGKCRLSSGWFVGVNATPRLIRTYDDSLSLVSSASAPLSTGTNRLYPAQRESSDGKVFCAEMNSSGTIVNWQRIDSSALTSDWSITAPTTADNEVVGLTADGDVYVLAVGGSIYRLSGTDGSTVWSTAFSSTGSGLGGWSYYLLRDGDYLLVVLAATSGKLILYDSQAVTVMALDYSDGSVVWARGLETAARLTSTPRLYDGYLYVAGVRTQRTTDPDLYP